MQWIESSRSVGGGYASRNLLPGISWLHSHLSRGKGVAWEFNGSMFQISSKCTQELNYKSFCQITKKLITEKMNVILETKKNLAHKQFQE